MFCTWVSSGVDTRRLKVKIARLLDSLARKMQALGDGRGRGGVGSGGQKRGRPFSRKLGKLGVRDAFECLDEDAEGVVSQHDMKVL